MIYSSRLLSYCDTYEHSLSRRSIPPDRNTRDHEPANMAPWKQPIPLGRVSIEEAKELRSYDTSYDAFLVAVNELFPHDSQDQPVFYGTVHLVVLTRSDQIIINNQVAFHHWLALQHAQTKDSQQTTTWKQAMMRFSRQQLENFPLAFEVIAIAQKLNELQLAEAGDEMVASSQLDKDSDLPGEDSQEKTKGNFDIGTTQEQDAVEKDLELAMDGDLAVEEEELRDLIARSCARINHDILADSWAAACQLVGHDSLKMSADDRIAAPGGGRPILPVQLFSVWEGIKQMEELGSIIHGHEMGLGKSTMYITTSTMYYFQTAMWKHIEGRPEKHHPNNTCKMSAAFLHVEM
ncbi:hypothetical protein HYALB_00002204 [Hymenoscyphus albidus]|uniref:Uncharacterized protein n=1 Tax=Hymenoscyphus albidus TaxID=595503 RepID=A0A9N9LH40_9HELO|nr:hypothetical protein HYALB_00002204 [Hymenoscyphus albidus]